MRIVLFALLILGWPLEISGALPQAASKTALVCELRNRKISESSGLAVSTSQRGVFWTNNDSGDGPNIYAFNLKGDDLGTFTLAGIKATDWEDMASVKLAGKSYLIVGDVGDNNEAREDIKIYRVPEPKAASGEHQVRSFETFTCRFPDGAHNTETVIAVPNGDIQLITKSPSGESGVYVLRNPKRSGNYMLKKLGTLKLTAAFPFGRLATGGAMSADGKLAVVRSYTSIWVFPVKNPDTWFRGAAKQYAAPLERQGESVAFDRSGSRLLTTSEGSPCRVSYVALKEKAGRAD